MELSLLRKEFAFGSCGERLSNRYDMAGHSKWAKVKRFKGAIDAKRGKIFAKLSKEITIAAKLAGGDPDMNPRLRMVLLRSASNKIPPTSAPVIIRPRIASACSAVLAALEVSPRFRPRTTATMHENH